MGPPVKREIKRTHSLFIDDLKTYQQNPQKLKMANEILVQISMDTGAIYGVQKYAEIVFKNGRIIKGEGTAQKMKFSIKDFFSKCDQIRSLVTFIEEILNGKFIFCAVRIADTARKSECIRPKRK